MNKVLIVLGFVAVQACSQKPYHGELDFLGELPSRLNEVSGIDTDKNGTFWAIEDSGNKDKIYKLDKKGRFLSEFKVDNAKNQDWEDLTLAQDGSLFIGDFGNNANARKNLVIYKIPASELEKKEPKAEKIKFQYPEQQKFPPKKKNLFYDAEGFFHWDGFLYLFTKNRSRPYSGKTLLYRVPDTKGDHQAELLGELTLCWDQDHCSVTGADISPDGTTIVLLGYGYLYVLRDFEFPELSRATVETIDLKYRTQMESICFLDADTIVIADEQAKIRGGNLYQYVLK